jgi:hypothetical protein
MLATSSAELIKLACFHLFTPRDSIAFYDIYGEEFNKDSDKQ